MTPRLLTIAGESRPLIEWATVPGAVSKETIRKRLWRGWLHADAVFLSLGATPLSLVQKPARQKPAPHLPNPLRPTVGRVRSYPLESIDLLRRLA